MNLYDGGEWPEDFRKQMEHCEILKSGKCINVIAHNLGCVTCPVENGIYDEKDGVIG